MDKFSQRKKDVLSKLDKSNKGSIDKDIKVTCEKINSRKDYFTTSSCSGRIVLISVDDENRKGNSKWLFTSHDLVDFKDIWPFIEGENVWFKQEPMILHVCCRDLQSAEDLWTLAKQAGYKRSGLHPGKYWFTVEIMGSEFIEAPMEGISENYFKRLLAEANKRMKRSLDRLEKLKGIL